MLRPMVDATFFCLQFVRKASYHLKKQKQHCRPPRIPCAPKISPIPYKSEIGRPLPHEGLGPVSRAQYPHVLCCLELDAVCRLARGLQGRVKVSFVPGGWYCIQHGCFIGLGRQNVC